MGTYLSRSHLVIIVLISLAAVVGIHFYANNRQFKADEYSQWVTHTHEVLETTVLIKNKVYQLESEQRGFSIQPITSSKLLIDTIGSELQVLLDSLQFLVSDNPVQEDRTLQLEQLCQQKIQFEKETLSMSSRPSYSSDNNLARLEQGVDITQRIRKVSNEIISMEKELLALRSLEAEERQDMALGISIVADIISILVILLCLFFLIRQITVIEKNRMQISNANAKLREFLDSIPIGVMVVESSGRLEFFNNSARKYFNLESIPERVEQLLKDIELLDRSDNRIDLKSLPIATALKGKNSSFKEVFLKRDDTTLILDVGAVPIFSNDGKVEYAISVCKDITAQKKIEAELKKARLDAEQSVLTRDLFLSNISHEIRTPLNAILGFSYLLRQNEGDIEKADQLDSIIQSGENLLLIINDLLDLSKIESGEMKIEKIPVELGGLIESVSVPMIQKSNSKGIDFNLNIDPNLPKVIKSDPLRLTQILNNLCGNAVKFTDKGRVTVSAYAGGQVKNHTSIFFEIIDTGIGIKQDRLPFIFDRFSQASEDISRKFGGTGLGLSIVKQLINLLGGNIKVESTLGQGTRFLVEIPVQVLSDKTNKKKGKIVEKTFNPNSKHDGKILVVEDNIINQKLMIAYLNKNGLQGELAYNGVEALEMVEEHDYDLIFMDIQMPEKNGYETTIELRKRGKTIPIIAMTAHAMSGERGKCLEIGMNEYLSKPIRERAMLQMVARFLDAENLTTQEVKTTDSNGMFNQEVIDDYKENPDIFSEIKAMFLEDYPQYLKTMESKVFNEDPEGMRKTVHKFRSSVLSIGLAQIGRDLGEIEKRIEETGMISLVNIGYISMLGRRIERHLNEISIRIHEG